MKRAAEGRGDVLPIGTLAVEYRHAGAARGQQLGAGTPHARSAADDDHLLAVDLHANLLVWSGPIARVSPWLARLLLGPSARVVTRITSTLSRRRLAVGASRVKLSCVADRRGDHVAGRGRCDRASRQDRAHRRPAAPRRPRSRAGRDHRLLALRRAAATPN